MKSVVDWVLTAAGQDRLTEDLHPLASIFIASLFILALVTLSDTLMHMWTKKRVTFTGMHCYITGGSRGTGKQLALQLARKGAHITIVARNQGALNITLAELNALPSTTQMQLKHHAISADMCDMIKSQAAVHEATRLKQGQCPHFVFCCAGQSLPGLFIEQDTTEFQRGIELNYLGTVHTLQTAAQLMVKNKVKGHLTMVASILGLFGVAGYSQYSPCKFALRGLAEVLDMELKPHGISVHCMFPATILTEGFEEEQKRKPAMTKKLEESDTPQSAEAIAKALLKGVKRNQLFITSDLIGELARCVGRGVARGNGVLGDMLLGSLGYLAFPVWRWSTEKVVRQHTPMSQ